MWKACAIRSSAVMRQDIGVSLKMNFTGFIVSDCPAVTLCPVEDELVAAESWGKNDKSFFFFFFFHHCHPWTFDFTAFKPSQEPKVVGANQQNNESNGGDRQHCSNYSDPWKYFTWLDVFRKLNCDVIQFSGSSHLMVRPVNTWTLFVFLSYELFVNLFLNCFYMNQTSTCTKDTYSSNVCSVGSY